MTLPTPLALKSRPTMKRSERMHGVKSRISTSPSASYRPVRFILTRHLRHSRFFNFSPPAKLVQANRGAGGNSLTVGSPIGRSPSVTSAGSGSSRSMPPSRAAPSSSFIKKAPPPPPGQTPVPPPPYSAASNDAGAGTSAATKRPPPPPPLKPKPKPEPVVEYVTALYDFDAQVRIYSIF